MPVIVIVPLNEQLLPFGALYLMDETQCFSLLKTRIRYYEQECLEN